MEQKTEKIDKEVIYKYYLDNKREIIKHFRQMFIENGDGDKLPEDDKTLENWYETHLFEIAEDWFKQEIYDEVYNSIKNQETMLKTFRNKRSDGLKQEMRGENGENDERM